MSLRYYANAPATTLTSSITNTATSIPVASVTGLPIQYPFTVILDRGTASEEAVSVTNVSALTLTAVRAIDGTTAFSHSVGATVEHGITAQDIRESNAHVNASNAVHGVAGTLVGTTDAQTLTNKDLSSGTNTFPTSLATLTGAQTLTNKTIALGSNTVSGTRAQFNTAMTDDDFASLAGTETLTNKNLSSSTNTFPTVSVKAANANSAEISAVPMSGTTATFDGVSLSVGDRVLIRDAGITTSYHGVYVVQSGSWTRDTNFDTSAKVAGTAVAVQQGTTYGGTRWTTNFKSTDTIGTTGMLWYRIVDTNATLTLTNKTLSTGTKLGGGTTDISGAWASWTPTFGGVLTPGNGTSTGLYLEFGKTIVFQAFFTLGSTSTVTGSGSLNVNIPVGTARTRGPITVLYLDSGNNVFAGMPATFTSTTIQMYGLGAGGAASAITSTSPLTWSVNDTIEVNGIYERL